jgi:hypothetical protein
VQDTDDDAVSRGRGGDKGELTGERNLFKDG